MIFATSISTPPASRSPASSRARTCPINSCTTPWKAQGARSPSATLNDITQDKKMTLQKLALVGRLLQSHFSQDYTFSSPLDIEWIFNDQGIFILQIRPYAK